MNSLEGRQLANLAHMTFMAPVCCLFTADFAFWRLPFRIFSWDTLEHLPVLDYSSKLQG